MKKQFGQFFTKNSDYILQGFGKYIESKKITDPFAGNKDLINWAKKHKAKQCVGFDIDRKLVNNKNIFYNDSVNNIRKYKFVLTNPPYLHKNKADTKTKKIFFTGNNKNYEDLYQTSINSILNSSEGILIVPLNFLSASNSKNIRDQFFNRFKIVQLNIFTERVFEDTTYNVISFYFNRSKNDLTKNQFTALILPDKRKIRVKLEKKYNWQFGGKFIKDTMCVKNRLGIYRLTEKDIDEGNIPIDLAIQDMKFKKRFKISKDVFEKLKQNIIILRAIDSKKGKKICLEDIREYGINGIVGKSTSRTLAHIIFNNNISLEDQEKIIDLFNKMLNDYREEYFSLFLTNFRDQNRKRISFDFAYKLINKIYYGQIKKQPTLF